MYITHSLYIHVHVVKIGGGPGEWGSSKIKDTYMYIHPLCIACTISRGIQRCVSRTTKLTCKINAQSIYYDTEMYVVLTFTQQAYIRVKDQHSIVSV